MAIKVCGCTVIDDSRCLNNIQDACITGTLTATNIVGDGSQLTGVGGGGPSAQPIYTTVDTNSTAISKGQPVSLSANCCTHVEEMLGDPSVVTDLTLNHCSICACDNTCTFNSFTCIGMAPFLCPAYNTGVHCYQCCRCTFEARASGLNPVGKYETNFRITQDRYVQIEFGGGIGYCCRECFLTLTNGCYQNCLGCVVNILGNPDVGSYQIPCYEIAEYKVDPSAKAVCKTKTAHLTAAANWACTDQQCYAFCTGCLAEGIMGIPAGGVTYVTEYCTRCCCDSCCSGLKQALRHSAGSSDTPHFDSDGGPATVFTFKCCYDTTCGYEYSLNGMQRVPLPLLKGPAANYTMNLPSCTGNKFYALMPVTYAKGTNNPTCCYGAFAGNVIQQTRLSALSLGLMSFCLCSDGTELDATSFCNQYDFNGNWRMGYVSKNKRFMFGEQSRVNNIACGTWCHCNRGCGFIYVNEINDNFVPNPTCGCIPSTNRDIDFGYAETCYISTSMEQEWRFWPTGETCDGWVIATQPVEELCYCCYFSEYCYVIKRNASYLKMFAIKPIATGCACITNVVCLCHKFSTDGKICWGGFNGETCTCTTYFAGLDYLACDSSDGTAGDFVVFDHDDRLSGEYLINNMWNEGNGMCRFFSKIQTINAKSNICDGQPTDHCLCGALPATNLMRVSAPSDANAVCLHFGNYWFPPLDCTGEYGQNSRMFVTCCCTCGTCCGCCKMTHFLGGDSQAVLCIDDATNCLTINSCTGFTKYCCATYGTRDCNFYGGVCILFRDSPMFPNQYNLDDFEEVNIFRAANSFGNGNTRRLGSYKISACQRPCCNFEGAFGSWCAINGCYGDFCGCNPDCCQCCARSDLASNRPVIEGFGLIDPLAFTWVTSPYLDQGRFTEDYLYSVKGSEQYCLCLCTNPCACQQICSNNKSVTSYCPNRNHVNIPLPFTSTLPCNCCTCYTSQEFRKPLWCQGQFCTCLIKRCAADSSCVCAIPGLSITSGCNLCPQYVSEAGSNIFVAGPESDSLINRTGDTYRYLFLSKPNQNNKACFVGWATADAQPGCTVPIMTVDRGYLPIENDMCGWCDLDLSNCVPWKCCIDFASGSGNSTCVTNFVYDTYSGACCLDSISPFKTCFCFCDPSNFQTPVICFAVGEDGCCCAYVTTRKTF